MPKFRTKCPFCPDNRWIDWYHDGCLRNEGIYINSEGYLECNYCGARWHIAETIFDLNAHSCRRSHYQKVSKKILLRIISSIDNLDDDDFDIIRQQLNRRIEESY